MGDEERRRTRAGSLSLRAFSQSLASAVFTQEAKQQLDNYHPGRYQHSLPIFYQIYHPQPGSGYISCSHLFSLHCASWQSQMKKGLGVSQTHLTPPTFGNDVLPLSHEAQEKLPLASLIEPGSHALQIPFAPLGPV